MCRVLLLVLHRHGIFINYTILKTVSLVFHEFGGYIKSV